MKQRVGIARAFAIQPKMLLLDEPFGALDALTRGTIQDELLKIVQATHQTVFMITHDVDEAILLADRIVLMTNGPSAKIAEIVVNTLPRNERHRNDHRHPQYSPSAITWWSSGQSLAGVRPGDRRRKLRPAPAEAGEAGPGSGQSAGEVVPLRHKTECKE
jgi:ABC-type nitrate/sulfonate/bicarbonate transport system ATPase subunit